MPPMCSGCGRTIEPGESGRQRHLECAPARENPNTALNMETDVLTRVLAQFNDVEWSERVRIISAAAVMLGVAGLVRRELGGI